MSAFGRQKMRGALNSDLIKDEFINLGIQDAMTQFLDKPNSSNRSLKDIYDRFLDLRRERVHIDQHFFFVVDQWGLENGGVLGISLDRNNDRQWQVGVARLEIYSARGWADELKENEAYWRELQKDWVPPEVAPHFTEQKLTEYVSFTGQIEPGSENARKVKKLLDGFHTEAAESAEAFGLPIMVPPYYGVAEDYLRQNFEVFKKPIMVFHTAPLGGNEFEHLEAQFRATSFSLVDPQPHFAEQPDFTGDSLRDVYDSFVDLRDKRDIHPNYFIVVDRTKFMIEGVLGVHLDCNPRGWESSQLGVARCRANVAAKWGVYISRGGVEAWERMKRSERSYLGLDSLHAPTASHLGHCIAFVLIKPPR